MNLNKVMTAIRDGDYESISPASIRKITIKEIESQSKKASTILANCIPTCHKAAQSENFSLVHVILQFIHYTCENDDWLIAVSKIVIPELNQIYLEILSAADPSKKITDGGFSVRISPRLQRKDKALRALRSVFEISIDCCDIARGNIDKYYSNFAENSAAVLFSSEVEQRFETVNEMHYALDELIRCSSYALSNILLTYPDTIRVLRDRLVKRIPALVSMLILSPELSVRQSSLTILKVLYDRIDNESTEIRSKIEDLIMEHQFSSKSTLRFFKSLQLDDAEYLDKAEDILPKLFHYRDPTVQCFRTKTCIVQLQIGSQTDKQIPFIQSSIDWNRNCIIFRIEDMNPVAWPHFTITKMDWKKKRREVRILRMERFDEEAAEIVVQFSSDLLSTETIKIIENRIHNAHNVAPLSFDLDSDIEANMKARKVSDVTLLQNNADESSYQDQSLNDSDCHEPLQAGEKNDMSGNGTIFENMEVDGILLLRAPTVDHDSNIGNEPINFDTTADQNDMFISLQKRRKENEKEDDSNKGSSTDENNSKDTSSGNINRRKENGKKDDSNKGSSIDENNSKDTSSGNISEVPLVRKDVKFKNSSQKKTKPNGQLSPILPPTNEVIFCDNSESEKQSSVVEITEVVCNKNEKNTPHKYSSEKAGIKNVASEYLVEHVSAAKPQNLAIDQEDKDDLVRVVKNIQELALKKRRKTLAMLKKSRENLERTRKEIVNKDVQNVTSFRAKVKLHVKKHLDKIRNKSKRVKTECHSTKKKLSSCIKNLQEWKTAQKLKEGIQKAIENTQSEMAKEDQLLTRQISTCLANNKRFKTSQARYENLLDQLQTFLKSDKSQEKL